MKGPWKRGGGGSVQLLTWPQAVASLYVNVNFKLLASYFNFILRASLLTTKPPHFNALRQDKHKKKVESESLRCPPESLSRSTYYIMFIYYRVHIEESQRPAAWHVARLGRHYFLFLAVSYGLLLSPLAWTFGTLMSPHKNATMRCRTCCSSSSSSGS